MCWLFNQLRFRYSISTQLSITNQFNQIRSPCLSKPCIRLISVFCELFTVGVGKLWNSSIRLKTEFPLLFETVFGFSLIISMWFSWNCWVGCLCYGYLGFWLKLESKKSTCLGEVSAFDCCFYLYCEWSLD